MKKLLDMYVHEHVLAGIAGLLCFLAYLTTMAPGLSFIDSGELATVASTLGIAHPTGYPLFALLGRLTVMVPFGGEEIVKLNFFAAAVTSIAVVFFFLCSVRIRSLIAPGAKRVGEKPPVLRALLPSLAGSLVFGLSTTVWAQSVVVEVYALHLFLLLAMLSAFLQAVVKPLVDPSIIPRNLFFASFLLGLGFTNHMTTILIVPALLFLYVRTWGWRREGLVLLGRLFPFFALGLSLYMYLPVRSGVQPALDWGHTASFERFFWHVSGKQYRSWIFSGFESAEKQFRYFGANLPAEFSWGVLAIAAFGVFLLFHRNRQMLYFLSIAFFTCLSYSINYDIHDIDAYFLLAYVVIGLLVVLGIEHICSVTEKNVVPWVLLAMFSLPIWHFVAYRGEVDESDNLLVRDYTMNILNNLEPNAVVFSYQWDFFIAPSLYYQTIGLVRPDVVVIDKELFRRSWYFVHLEKQVPWLIDRSREKVEAFLKELHKFEHDLPYNPRVIEARFVGMINDFIDKTMVDRPVYVGPEIEPEFGSSYKRIPEGLIFRLVESDSMILAKKPDILYRKAKIENKYTELMRMKYAQMLTLTAVHLRDAGNLRDAREVVERVVEMEPTFQPAYQLRRQLESVRDIP